MEWYVSSTNNIQSCDSDNIIWYDPGLGWLKIWIVTNNISTQIWAENKVSRYSEVKEFNIL